MNITHIISVICVAATMSGVPAFAQQPPAPPKLDLAEIPDGATDQFVAKSNAVVGLLNTSLRGSESWQRYLSWVDAKRGPTGRERIIYGLYSVSASSAKDDIAKARKSAESEPSIPSLDAATKELASTFETLVPILNEAEAYYDRKDYMDDKMAGGKALHARLVPAAIAFLSARERAERLQEQLKGLIDTQELARLEKTEGKSVKWHTRRVLIMTKRAVDLMPQDPRRGGDLKAFDAAIVELASATREFDAAVRDSGKSGSVDSQPRDILGSLREIREKVSKGRADPRFYSMDYNSVIMRYNMMISMSNAFR